MTTMEYIQWTKEFDANYANKCERLMEMKKDDIIREGITWGIWANNQSTFDYMKKHYTKKNLAEILASRLIRLENRGY